jgi:1,4-alpha-glucan branching enzyme
LDWHLVSQNNPHQKLQHWVGNLNHAYQTEQALYQSGFEWLETADAEMSTLALLRRNAHSEVILAVFNFTPVPRHNYRVGVPGPGFWCELLNSDALEFGGSGQGNFGGVEAAPFGWHYKPYSLLVTLPPLGAVFFKQAIK